MIQTLHTKMNRETNGQLETDLYNKARRDLDRVLV